MSRTQLIKKFIKNNIQVRPVWKLNHLQEPYKNYQTYKIENSLKLIKNSICLPSSQNLDKEDLNRIINTLHA